jgi:hypothetical protein
VRDINGQALAAFPILAVFWATFHYFALGTPTTINYDHRLFGPVRGSSVFVGRMAYFAVFFA